MWLMFLERWGAKLAITRPDLSRHHPGIMFSETGFSSAICIENDRGSAKSAFGLLWELHEARSSRISWCRACASPSPDVSQAFC